LFLEAMLTAIRERGGSELPESLDALLAAQIDAMPPLSRTILRHASVLGTSTSTTVLRNLLAAEGIVLDDATLRTLREHLVADGRNRIRFRSAMVRDAAYAGLAFRRRRELHSRAAVILAAQSRPEEVADRLALHHLRAQEYERAWHFARIAGEHAQRAAANEAAALQYEHALAAASLLPDVDHRDVIDVWTRLGDVRVAAGVFDGGLHAYTRAAKLSHGDSLTHAEMLLRRARAQERAGRFSDALRTTTRIRTLTETVDGADPVRARALSFRCVVRSAQERFSDVIPVARAAITAADACGSKEGLAEALKALAWANQMLGRPDVESHAQRALALYEELGDLDGQGRVHGELGGHKVFSGEWDAALWHYQRAEDAFRMIGDTVRAAMTAASVGEIRVSQGRFEDARPHLTAAARTMRASGFVDGATFAEINLARVYMGQGCLSEAIALLDQVIAEVDQLGLASSTLEASLYRAECDIRLGHPAEALRRLTASKRAAGSETAVFGAALARVDALGLAALGETGLALDRLEQGIQIARGQGLVYELALLCAARDQLPIEIDLTDAAETDELLTRLGVEPTAPLLSL
jgi:tetratricopeptide (TPR) repeat protein